jgi:cystathionine beta-lyase/cystathionine gamma-synthase
VLAGSIIAAANNAETDRRCAPRPRRWRRSMLAADTGLAHGIVRYRQASANALAVARHFEVIEDRGSLSGLKSHGGHEIAKQQMTDGFGGMLSLLVKGGYAEAQKLCTRLKLIVPATSSVPTS